jgi:hypothetical protein
LPRGIGPGQCPQPVGRDRAGQRRRDIGRVSRFGAVGENQRSQSSPTPRQHPAGNRIETGFDLLGDAIDRQRVGVERCGQPDARRSLQLQRGNRQQRCVGERIGTRQPRAATARQPEAAWLAAALRDAVGKRRCEQPAGIAIGGRIGALTQPPAVLAGDPADARQRTTVRRRIARGIA